MKKTGLIKVSIEYKNAFGMSVIVNKRVTQEEFDTLKERADVTVHRVDNIEENKIA
ncbi:MAG: hypothetical protein MJ123_07270 [Lachnospiraceae bacterium]|nr:hypothetical protein [Lachnospiraceae bacterium]